MNIQLSFTNSILLFILSAGCIWYFCTKLSEIVDYIDNAFKLGSAFGGTIMLSIVTNLPEIAITLNSAIKGNTDLAVGNILGGITVQSALLVLFDFAGGKNTKPLSTLTSDKTSLLQGLFLVAILSLVIIGKQFNEAFLFSRTTPPEILIFITWIASIFAMKRFQKNNPEASVHMPSKKTMTKFSSVVWLIIVSIAVLVFGVLLEITSNTIAVHLHITGVLFGATILALITSMPEISGGLAFVKHKSYKPIISDIFGGNIFLPVLFLPATLITNKAIIPTSSNIDIYLTVTSIIITTIYLMGMIVQNAEKKFGLGIDSWVVLGVYVCSILGMFYL